MKVYTDIEQSRKLEEILPLKSADMCYIKHSSSDNPNWEFNEDFPPMILGNVPINEITAETLPCWSLVALLNLLPNEISTGERHCNKYQIHIRKYDGGDNTTFHQIAYGNNRGSSGSWHDMINTSERENLIDAAFEMICWLKENNKL